MVNLLQENSYVVYGEGGSCVVVDPGISNQEEAAVLRRALEGHKLEAVLLTHGHFDHIYGVASLQREYGVPVYMSPDDIKTMEYYDRVAKFGLLAADHSFSITPVSEGSVVKAAGLNFKVITTPGHSPGCVCWLEESEGVMFTGDTLLAGTIGRTDLIYGDYDDEIRSIMNKLMGLDGNIQILPGHGESSTIGTERATNPFLEPFNEREEIPELNDEQ